MILNYRIYDGKPQTASGLLGGEKRIENFLYDRLGNSASAIMYCDLNIQAPLYRFRVETVGTCARGTAPVVAHSTGDVDKSAVVHCLGAVFYQICQYLTNLDTVHMERRQARLKIIQTGDRGPIHGKHGKLGNKFTGVVNPENGRSSAGKGQKLPGYFTRPKTSLFCALYGIPCLFVRNPYFCQPDVAQDNRENIVEIVGDPAGENSDRFHFLPTHERFTHFLFRGDIRSRKHDPAGIIQVKSNSGKTALFNPLVFERDLSREL